jgi:hypothetical protein
MKPEKWKVLFEEWERSDLTQAEFCRQKGLKWHRFHYWKTKLMSGSQKENGKLKLVEVKVGDSESLRPSRDPFMLERGEWSLKIPPGFDGRSLMVIMNLLTVCK